MKILKFQVNAPHFPRCIYLLQTIEDVRRFLPNAFVFFRVRWDMLENLTIEKNDIQRELKSQDVSPLKFFMDLYPWTMIPFNSTSTPNGNKRQIIKNDLDRIIAHACSSRGWDYTSSPQSATLESSPSSILIEAGGRMSPKLNGVLYNTPCEMCKNLFSHIAGNCQIIDYAQARVMFCHMKMVWGADTIQKPSIPEESTPLHPVLLNSL